MVERKRRATAEPRQPPRRSGRLGRICPMARFGGKKEPGAMALIDGVGVQGPRRTGTVRPRPGAPAWRGIAPGETEPHASASLSGAAPTPALEGLLALQ